MISKTEMMKKLLSGVAERSQEGSLENLRDVFEKMEFSSSEEKKLAKELVAYAHLACSNLDAEKIIFAIRYFAELENWPALSGVLEIARFLGNQDAIAEIKKIGIENNLPELQIADEKEMEISDGFEKVNADKDVDALFRKYCAANGIMILRRLQRGIKEIRYSSFVYLIYDRDGLVKICKELLDYKTGRFGKIFNNEDEIYARLSQNDNFPRYYETIEVGQNLRFIKMSVRYGQPLADYIRRENLLSKDEVKLLVRKVAEHLRSMHEQEVLYLDLKPENILVNGSQITLLDFGISRILGMGEREINIFLADPKYGTPEGGMRLKTSKAAEIFQLGILFHELLTGEHPFAAEYSLMEGDEYRESTILKYFWLNIMLPYERRLGEELGDATLEIVKKMLDKNPEKRPSLDEVIRELESSEVVSIQQKGRAAVISRKRNIVLFPARMGIPHKGHIEYIARLIELGFHVMISLQRSYTITDRDPIPKWLVMKMVAQSLLERGFPQKDFSFVFTGLYRTRAELKMHFAMMPRMEDVVAVASSNPEVGELFNNSLLLDQRSLFSLEGEEYDDLSCGEKLRSFVRNGDYESFQNLAASGVEKIADFEALRRIYAQPRIDFVSGKVEVVLLDAENKEMVTGRIFRYLSPEESIARHLQRSGIKAEILDPYARNTIVNIEGVGRTWEYVRTEFDSEKEVIFFKCA